MKGNSKNNWYDEPIERGFDRLKDYHDIAKKAWEDILRTYHLLGFNKSEVIRVLGVLAQKYTNMPDLLVPILNKWTDEIWQKLDDEEAAKSV